MSFLVIRARSDRGVTRKIRETMAMLNLTRVNHATIVWTTRLTVECYRSPRITSLGAKWMQRP